MQEPHAHDAQDDLPHTPKTSTRSTATCSELSAFRVAFTVARSRAVPIQSPYKGATTPSLPFCSVEKLEDSTSAYRRLVEVAKDPKAWKSSQDRQNLATGGALVPTQVGQKNLWPGDIGIELPAVLNNCQSCVSWQQHDQ